MWGQHDWLLQDRLSGGHSTVWGSFFDLERQRWFGGEWWPKMDREDPRYPKMCLEDDYHEISWRWFWCFRGGFVDLGHLCTIQTCRWPCAQMSSRCDGRQSWGYACCRGLSRNEARDVQRRPKVESVFRQLRGKIWDRNWYWYGSIPFNTIFKGNIHKSQLFWCEQKGYKVLTHCHIGMAWNGSKSKAQGPRPQILFTVHLWHPILGGYRTLTHSHGNLQVCPHAAADVEEVWRSPGTFHIIDGSIAMVNYISQISMAFDRQEEGQSSEEESDIHGYVGKTRVLESENPKSVYYKQNNRDWLDTEFADFERWAWETGWFSHVFSRLQGRCSQSAARCLAGGRIELRLVRWLDAHPCLTRILDRWYVKLKVKTCPLLQFSFLWYEHVQNILWRFPKIGKKTQIIHFK